MADRPGFASSHENDMTDINDEVRRIRRRLLLPAYALAIAVLALPVAFDRAWAGSNDGIPCLAGICLGQALQEIDEIDEIEWADQSGSIDAYRSFFLDDDDKAALELNAERPSWLMKIVTGLDTRSYA